MPLNRPVWTPPSAQTSQRPVWTPPEPQGDLELAGKSVATGFLGLADLPQLLAALAHKGMMTDTFEDIPSTEHSLTLGNLPLASKKIKEGVQDVTDVDLTPRPSGLGQKILSKGFEVAGGGGLTSIPRKLLTEGVKQGLKSSAKQLAPLAATGGVSAGLHEAGMNPLAADLSSAVLTPAALMGGKTALSQVKKMTPSGIAERATNRATEEVNQILKNAIGDEEEAARILKVLGEHPENAAGTTAEVADNLGLMQLQKATSGSSSGPLAERQALDNQRLQELIQKRFFGKTPEEIQEELIKALSSLETGTEAGMAGEAARSAIEGNINTLKEARKKATQPLYEEVDALKTPVSTQKSHDFIASELASAKGKEKKELERLRKDLEPNQKKTLRTLRGEPVSLKKTTLPSNIPLEIRKALKELNDRISTATSGGERELAHTLRKAKDAILEDLSSVPAIKEANTLFSKMSKPISRTEKDPILGKALKKVDEYGTLPTYNNEELAGNLIRESLKTKEGARNLLREIKPHPEQHQKIQEYVRQDLRDAIGEDPLSGSFNVNRIKTWEKKHPYVSEIDPTLSAEINKIKEKGLFAGMSKTFENSILTGSIDASGLKRMSFDKFDRFMKNNGKVLKEKMTPDQNKVLQEVYQALKQKVKVSTASQSVGSQTIDKNTILHNMLGGVKTSLFEAAIPDSKWAKGLVNAYKLSVKAIDEKKIGVLLEKALADPQVAKLLLTPTGDKKTITSLLKEIYKPEQAKSLLGMVSSVKNDVSD